MVAIFSFALIGMVVSCNKDDDKDNNGGSNSPIVGTWNVSEFMVNGQDRSSWIPDNSQIVINANGSGSFKIGGHDYSFSWTLNGNELTIDNGGGNINCHITNQSANEITFTSSNMSLPVLGPVSGEVTITITRDASVNDPNNYSALLLGTWRVDGMTHNGQDISASEIQGTITLTFYEGGTGVIDENGNRSNFQWVINGTSITVTGDREMVFTINSLTATECTFSGTNMVMGHQQMQGEITIHMVKNA